MKPLPPIVLVLIALLLLSSLCRAATCTTTSTTTWSCMGGPGSNDDLVINHDITISADFVVNNGSITVNSPNTLTIDGDLTFNNNSVVLVNAGATIHVTGNLLNKNNSGDIEIFGNLIIDGNFTNGTGSGNGAVIDVGDTGTIRIGGTCSNPGDVENSDGTFSGCDNEILPVELVFFRGRHHEGINILEWQTATEINNDYFLIERSQDAVNWKELGTVAGNGSSEVLLNYHYRDDRPLYGNNYYRLKQVDYDGQFEYFPIILVKTGELSDLSVESTFPNPTTGLLQVNYLSNNSIRVRLKMYNSSGSIVIQKDLENRPGINRLTLSMGQLVSGVYFLSMENGKDHFRQKIIKN